MQLQKQTRQDLAISQTNNYTRHLLNALAVGSTGQVFNEMCRWKDKGEPLPMMVIQQIPVKDRLPGLVNTYGMDKVSAILAKAINRALSNFNLRVGMNADQVMELSLQLIDSANEDQLAFEDIMLFLDGMIKAKYGKVYDRMDIPTFFEMLENYRDERHRQYVRFKDEQNAQFKSSGDQNRSSDDVTSEKDQFRNAMKNYMQESAKKS
jgi:hypothetical protein